MPVLCQILDFQRHTSWSFLCSVSSVKVRHVSFILVVLMSVTVWYYFVIALRFSGEMREHTKSVIESRIWKDDRKYNGRMVICKVCQAVKRSSAVTPVISRVFQGSKRLSAVTLVICKVCQACRQFSAVNSVICTVCQIGKSVFCRYSIICQIYQASRQFSSGTPITCKVCHAA
jgi:hypothetical protein